MKKYLVEDLKSMKMGPVEDLGNFINAVIDEKSFDSITGYIEKARKNPMNEIISLVGSTISRKDTSSNRLSS